MKQLIKKIHSFLIIKHASASGFLFLLPFQPQNVLILFLLRDDSKMTSPQIGHWFYHHSPCDRNNNRHIVLKQDNSLFRLHPHLVNTSIYSLPNSTYYAWKIEKIRLPCFLERAPHPSKKRPFDLAPPKKDFCKLAPPPSKKCPPFFLLRG